LTPFLPPFPIISPPPSSALLSPSSLYLLHASSSIPIPLYAIATYTVLQGADKNAIWFSVQEISHLYIYLDINTKVCGGGLIWFTLILMEWQKGIVLHDYSHINRVICFNPLKGQSVTNFSVTLPCCHRVR
jgi:hypothetical protein